MDLRDNYAKPEKISPVMYRRRLDRTPDKSFEKLTMNDKVLLSTLRVALEGTKSRIDRLRDDKDEKDHIIDEEQQLRKAAEQNLHLCLVDIYKSPDVNLELCHRLPHAKKAYTLHHMPEIIKDNAYTTNVFDSSDAVRVDSTTRHRKQVAEMSYPFTSKSNMDTENSSVAKDDLSQPFAGAGSGSLETRENTREHRTNENPSQQRSRRREPDMADTYVANRHLDDSRSSSAFEVSQGTQDWLRLMSISQLLPPYINSTMYASSLSPASWSSQESSVYHGLPQVSRQEDHRDKGHDPKLQRYKSEQALSTMGTQTTPQYLQTPNSLPKPAGLVTTHSTSLPSLAHIPNPGPAQPTFVPSHFPSYSTRKYDPVPSGAVEVSHMSRLLADMAVLKKENEELREKLRAAKLGTQMGRKSVEELNLDKIGALIEEIHDAEKKRNMAVEKLMGAADKDRPDTLEKLKHLEKKYASKSVQAVTDSELPAVYDSEFSEAEDYEDGLANISQSTLTDSTEDKTMKQRYIEKLVARQREIMKEEMQKVLDERNEARQRVMKLEKKLASLELARYTDNRSSALLAKLRVTERERDISVARLKYLAQDVSETKLMYNLHKALMSDDPANHTSSYHVSKKSNLDIDLTKTFVTSMEAEENVKYQAKITMLESEKRSQAKHIEKLEQLVTRQRRKLNALCAGPMLMGND